MRPPPARTGSTPPPTTSSTRRNPLIAPVLTARPHLRIATKTRFFTAATSTDAVNDGALTGDQAITGHSLAPDFVRWQLARNREQFGRDRLDLVLLHNPERAHPGDRPALHCAILDAFADLEEAVAARHVTGYGIATWAGLDEEAFTVEELLTMAAEAADGTAHHLAAVQMPVSLVMMTPIVQALGVLSDVGDTRAGCLNR